METQTTLHSSALHHQGLWNPALSLESVTQVPQNMPYKIQRLPCTSMSVHNKCVPLASCPGGNKLSGPEVCCRRPPQPILSILENMEAKDSTCHLSWFCVQEDDLNPVGLGVRSGILEIYFSPSLGSVEFHPQINKYKGFPYRKARAFCLPITL